jgi:hypothetical protein
VGKIYSGACFCGAVELEVSGQPEAMGYCHCQSCRSWAASPVNAFTLLEAGKCEGDKGGRSNRRLPQERDAPSSILPDLRRTRDVEPSGLGTDRCIRGDHQRLPVSAAASCQLRRDGAAYARRASENEGLSRRTGWFRRNHRRIVRLCCVERQPVQYTLPKGVYQAARRNILQTKPHHRGRRVEEPVEEVAARLFQSSRPLDLLERGSPYTKS